ncbi:sensor histidine kinase [Streptomyces sp. NBC_00286]|uniref:sensor histidine kinase n=1 Tax=Streptomyces sp. NBC_00286 TaxID=2975701 RepID=UPI002E286D75|nr:ATP-binding protein [Streptomyces sp. NBC_00286]
MLAIVMHARQLSAQSVHAPKAAHAIEELAVEAQREIRAALGRLPRSEQASDDAPLSDRVTALGVDLPEVDLTLHFSGVEAEENLHASTRHAALRIIQEGVSNAIKHGEGPIDVRVEFGEQLHVSIVNGPAPGNGAVARSRLRGGTVAPLVPGSGQGLLHMRRRAAELGGSFCYQELPGGGVRIMATLPSRPGRPVEATA